MVVEALSTDGEEEESDMIVWLVGLLEICVIGRGTAHRYDVGVIHCMYSVLCIIMFGLQKAMQVRPSAAWKLDAVTVSLGCQVGVETCNRGQQSIVYPFQ